MNLSHNQRLYLGKLVEETLAEVKAFTTSENINIYQNIDNSVYINKDQEKNEIKDILAILIKNSIYCCEKNNIKKINIYINIYEKNNSKYMIIEDNCSPEKNINIDLVNSFFKSFEVDNIGTGFMYKIEFNNH